MSEGSRESDESDGESDWRIGNSLASSSTGLGSDQLRGSSSSTRSGEQSVDADSFSEYTGSGRSSSSSVSEKNATPPKLSVRHTSNVVFASDVVFVGETPPPVVVVKQISDEDLESGSDDMESSTSSCAIPTLKEATGGRSQTLDLSALRPGHSAIHEEKNAGLSQKMSRHRRLVSIVKYAFLTVLGVLFVAGIVVPWYVTLVQGVDSADSIVAGLTEAVSNGLASELMERLEVPLDLGQSNAFDVLYPSIVPMDDSNDFSMWVRRFRDQSERTNSRISLEWIYCVLNGSLESAGVRRLKNGQYEFFAVLREGGNNSLDNMRIWNSSVMDPTTAVPVGFPTFGYFNTSVSSSGPLFLPRDEPVAENATKIHTYATLPEWSPVFVRYENGTQSASVVMAASSSAFLNTSGQPKGFFHSDYSLNSVSEYLIESPSFPRGVAYVTEPSGELVGVSTGEPLVLMEGPSTAQYTVRRKRAIDLTQKYMVCTASFMQENAKNASVPFDLGPGVWSVSHEMDCRGDSLRFGLRRFESEGLDWVVVVAVPVAEFTSDLRRESAIALGIVLFGFLIALIALVVFFWAIRWYLRTVYKGIEKALMQTDEIVLEGSLIRAIAHLRSFGQSRSDDDEFAAVISRVITAVTQHVELLYQPDFLKVVGLLEKDVRDWVGAVFLANSARFSLCYPNEMEEAPEAANEEAEDEKIREKEQSPMERQESRESAMDIDVVIPQRRRRGHGRTSSLSMSLRRSQKVNLSFFEPNGEIDSILSRLDSWEFGIFDLAKVCRERGRPLLSLLTMAICNKKRMFDDNLTYGVEFERFGEFLARIQDKYCETNAFHNSVHASDVVQTLHYVLTHGFEDRVVSHPLDYLALLIAGLFACIDHPGADLDCPNEKVKELALRYNDQSVLQHHSLSVGLTILENMDASGESPFVDLAAGDKKRLRWTIIQLVLATDPARHFEILGRLRARMESPHFDIRSLRGVLIEDDEFGEKGTEDERGFVQRVWYAQDYEGAEEDRLLIMQLILMFAVSGSSARPLEVSREWAQRFLEERFICGDRRKEAGLPCLAFSDRETTNMAHFQHSMVGLVTAPILGSLHALVPLTDLWDQLQENVQTWADQMSASDRQGLI